FRDVAGYAQAKKELLEVVDYLRSPGAFRHQGGEPPRNVLLVGPPGTGKTMFARAAAQAANATILYGSGSDFVEMLVGVGAARIRDLFRQAAESAPALVFIDELDALARKRAPDLLGRTQEHDNTLNELLTQLDGFLTRHDRAVVFVGATNREDVLDPA